MDTKINWFYPILTLLCKVASILKVFQCLQFRGTGTGNNLETNYLQLLQNDLKPISFSHILSGPAALFEIRNGSRIHYDYMVQSLMQFKK